MKTYNKIDISSLICKVKQTNCSTGWLTAEWTAKF